MFGNRSRIRGGWLASGGSLLLAGLVACANAAPAPETAQEPGTLEEVSVRKQGDATVVGLVGPSAPSYTAYRKSEPKRVVLELAGVGPGEVDSPVAVYDGTIEEVSLSARDPEGTRVELGLAGEASYEVTPGEGGLEVRVTRETGGTGATETSGEAASAGEGDAPKDPWARAESPAEAESAGSAEDEEGAGGAAEASAEGTTGEPEAGSAESRDPASALLGVRVPEGEGAAIELETDGRVESKSRFVLDDPHRLVVDLPGLESKVDEDRIEVGREGVARVRVGRHPEKVRVVVDAAEEGASFGDARLVHTDAGLRVALEGSAEGAAESAAARTAEAGAPDAAEGEEATPPAAAAPAGSEATALAGTEGAEGSEGGAAAPEASGTSGEAGASAGSESAAGDAGTVYGVQFDGQAERDRVAILTEGEPQYEVGELDSETVVVRLMDATIDPEASVRVAPDGPGPVSLVTAFQQPESATPEVRVVIRRAEDLEPEVQRKGGFLFVDFPRGEKTASAVPALGEEPAGASGSGTDETEGGGEASKASETAFAAASEAAADSAPSGSTASTKAAARTREEAAPAAPAAVQKMDNPVDVLQEGGLVEGKEYSGRRISLDFKDVEIDDVLRLIAEVSGLNIIAGDDVQGQVTIRLVEVPWDQALDVILLTKGLGFTRVGNVLRIAPADVLQKEKEARLQEKRSQEKLEDLVVKLQPVNYADAGEVKGLVQRLLTERGSVHVDERTNTVILKDIPSVIDEATALIKAVDTQTPQVLIEARIVEANVDFSRNLGSSFGFGTQPFTDPLNSGGGNRTDIDAGEDVLFDSRSGTNNISVTNPIGSATGLMNLGAFLIDERFSVDVTLQAAETNEELKIISSPRVVTLDNQPATIESGQEIPFQSGISDGGATQLQFEEAKTKLEVTPHITPDKSIVMEVMVEKSSVSESVESSTGDPAIDTNEAEAKTLVKDGQTLVIGGLRSSTEQENESRVPFFHQIPILGNAFKNKRIVDDRRELLIFVTPRIVESPQVGS